MSVMSVLDNIADKILKGINDGLDFFLRISFFVLKIIYIVGLIEATLKLLIPFDISVVLTGSLFIVPMWVITFLIWRKWSNITPWFYQNFSIATITCQHCSYEWAPRYPHNTTKKLPAQCPRCQRKIS